MSQDQINTDNDAESQAEQKVDGAAENKIDIADKTEAELQAEYKDNDIADLWEIPNVKSAVVDEDKTNAFGLKSNWRYEPPESTQEAEPAPLTAQDIEDIRQAAFDEGFSDGKEEGFAKGFEEGKTQGHEQGLAAGTEEGITQGVAQGQEQIETLAKQWQALVDDLHEPIKKVEGNVENQLLHLLVQLVEAVTLQEAKTNPDILLAAISEGIKALPMQEPATQIYLNPQDIKMVEKEFGAEHIQEKGWRLLPHPHQEIGSCQIENSTSNIDLTIKSRLKEVLDSFLQESLHQ
ncbi:MAG: flagellar assembly protein FliH [Thalassotalea sp.]